MKSNNFVESNEYMPSPSGQNTSMPPKTPPAHPLGPYAPRPVGSMVANADDYCWMPSPSGQIPQSTNWQGKGNAPVSPDSRPAPTAKGTGPDEVALPTPSGQYPHGKAQMMGGRDSGPRG
jgi:hypothetical protein